MRLASALSAALALTGCGAQQTPEPEFDPHWPGHVAINDEFEIRATFPDDRPVCVSDSGTHIHGFHQWRDGDCADQGNSQGRFLAVWADHNAMDWDGATALAETCGIRADRLSLNLQPTAGGRLDVCRPKTAPDARASEVAIVALYVPASGRGGLPDMIYTVRMGTTHETEEADLAALHTFLSSLVLAGSSFRPAAS